MCCSDCCTLSQYMSCMWSVTANLSNTLVRMRITSWTDWLRNRTCHTSNYCASTVENILHSSNFFCASYFVFFIFPSSSEVFLNASNIGSNSFVSFHFRVSHKRESISSLFYSVTTGKQRYHETRFFHIIDAHQTSTLFILSIVTTKRWLIGIVLFLVVVLLADTVNHADVYHRLRSVSVSHVLFHGFVRSFRFSLLGHRCASVGFS
jgi:hypothetical protein